MSVTSPQTPTVAVQVPVPTPVSPKPKTPAVSASPSASAYPRVSFGGETDPQPVNAPPMYPQNRRQLRAIILPWTPSSGVRRMNRSSPRRYGADQSTVDTLLSNLTHHDRLGTEQADWTRRKVTADALQDIGREDEADLLRSSGPVWVRNGKVESAEQRSAVSLPRGSWRWQDAYTIVWYRPQRVGRGRQRRWSLVPVRRMLGKYSEPQLRRAGYGDAFPSGSLRGALTAQEEEYLNIPHNERRFPPTPPPPPVLDPDYTDEHGNPTQMRRLPKKVVKLSR